jgi:peptidyl-prolyl cis-trans isomerase D
MLDIMRRKNRLKIILWFVLFSLTLGMMLFFVPGMNMGTVATDTSAATVDGKAISMQAFAEAYRRVVKNYSNGGKNRTDPEMLKAMGLPKQVLDGLVTEKVVEVIANRFGVEVTPEEIRHAVETHPYLQDQGKFIGLERYKAVLASNNISISDFEEDIRNAQMVKKVRAIITDSMNITEQEVRDEFARTNQQTVVDYVILKKDEFGKNVKPTDAELRAYFDGHKDAYRIKEKRRAQYLLVLIPQTLPGVTDQEILAEWNQASHEETVDAAHILFKVDDAAKEAEIKSKAEAILKRAKAGESFAELAKKNSDDTGSASQGGLLGPFQRGQMVKEFEDAAFSLKVGEISGLVRSQYGFHIIKALNHEIPTLESSKPRLVFTIQKRKALELARQKAEQIASLSQKQKDLNLLAKESGGGVEVKETGFFSKEDDPTSLGISQALRDDIFELKEINSIGKVAQLPAGFAIPKLIEVQMPKPGEFTESLSKVKKDFIEFKSKEVMQASAKKLSEEGTKQGSLEKAAKGMALAVKTSQPFNISGTPSPEIGASSSFTQAAFELAPGQVSASLPLLDNEVVMQVKTRSPFDEAAFQKQRSELREKLLESNQDPYFQDYVRRAVEDLEKGKKIRINPKALESSSLLY